MIIDPMNIDKDKTLCSVEMKYVTALEYFKLTGW